MKQRPIIIKQGWANNEEIRKKASSGGVATAIAVYFYKNVGTVSLTLPSFLLEEIIEIQLHQAN